MMWIIIKINKAWLLWIRKQCSLVCCIAWKEAVVIRWFKFKEHKLPLKLRHHLFPTIHVDKTHPLEQTIQIFTKIVLCHLIIPFRVMRENSNSAVTLENWNSNCLHFQKIYSEYSKSENELNSWVLVVISLCWLSCGHFLYCQAQLQLAISLEIKLSWP